MRLEEFQQYAKSCGYKLHEKLILGEFGGYPFSMAARYSRDKIFVSVTVSAAGNVPKHVIRQIKQTFEGASQKKLAVTAAPGKKNALLISLSGTGEPFVRDLETAIRVATACLKNAPLPPPETCAVCKAAGSDAYAWHGGHYTSVHKACLEKICRGTVTDMQNRQENGSYLRGAVGALLGAFAGAIPNFISIYFAHYIIGYLCALIPLASFWGYRLFKGKPNKPATAIILLCSLLQVFILDQAVWYASIVDNFGIWPSVFDSIRLYVDLFDSSFIGSLLQTALFVGVGIVLCFVYISKTADTQIRSAMSVMDTMTDRPGAGFASVMSEQARGEDFPFLDR